MLPVDQETLVKELASARELLAKWEELVTRGLPGIHVPVTGDKEEEQIEFLRIMIGELRIISGKCDTLVAVLEAA
jgi:hypothetical protein